MKTRLLIVDDEPQVVEGLELVLRKGYQVTSAVGGDAGIRALREKGPFPLVLSDMRMPGMDGAAFLAQVREESPDSVRLLLTGYSDLDAAVRAVNEGQIFRFLTKPCPTPTLMAALAEAERQFQLVAAERELLEKTAHGSIAALVDMLGLVQPAVFGRATRLRKRAGAPADKVGVPDRWQIEVAALLSQVGFVALPPSLTDRWFRGEAVTPEERAMVERVPAIGEKLLAHIPRLDGVLELMRLHPTRYDEAMRANKPLPMGARILRLVIDLDEVEAALGGQGGAVEVLAQRKGRYDPQLLEAAEDLFGGETERRPMELPVSRLEARHGSRRRASHGKRDAGRRSRPRCNPRPPRAHSKLFPKVRRARESLDFLDRASSGAQPGCPSPVAGPLSPVPCSYLGTAPPPA